MTYATGWSCSGTLIGTVTSQTCTVTSTATDSSSGSIPSSSTSSPLFVQDVGNVPFGLAIIITILFFALLVYLYNLFGNKKHL